VHINQRQPPTESRFPANNQGPVILALSGVNLNVVNQGGANNSPPPIGHSVEEGGVDWLTGNQSSPVVEVVSLGIQQQVAQESLVVQTQWGSMATRRCMPLTLTPAFKDASEVLATGATYAVLSLVMTLMSPLFKSGDISSETKAISAAYMFVTGAFFQMLFIGLGSARAECGTFASQISNQLPDRFKDFLVSKSRYLFMGISVLFPFSFYNLCLPFAQATQNEFIDSKPMPPELRLICVGLSMPSVWQHFARVRGLVGD